MTVSGKVLIAGAGPVGLFLALGLLRRGIDVQVFEREERLPQRPGIGTIFPSTMEMFQQNGIDDAILEQGQRVPELQFWDCDETSMVAELPFSIIDQQTEYPFHLHCTHEDIVRILADRVSLLSPSAICTGYDLQSVEERGDKVVAKVATFEGEFEVEGDYIVGADGKDSSLRDMAGIPSRALVEDHRFLMVESDLDFSRHFPDFGNAAYLYCGQNCISVIRYGDRVQAVFPISADESDRQIRDENRARERLFSLIGDKPDIDIKQVAVSYIRPSVADSFKKGRVLLAGDAAHSHGTPVDGVCLNSGFHDADHLARVLQMHLVGNAGVSELDDYASLRRRAALDHIQKSTNAYYHDHANRQSRKTALASARLAAMASSKETARTYLLRASFMGAHVSVSSAESQSLTLA